MAQIGGKPNVIGRTGVCGFVWDVRMKYGYKLLTAKKINRRKYRLDAVVGKFFFPFLAMFFFWLSFS